MHVGQAVSTLLKGYVVVLVLVAVLTILWIVASSTGGSKTVAALWFAVAAFGTLVVVIVGLVQAIR